MRGCARIRASAISLWVRDWSDAVAEVLKPSSETTETGDYCSLVHEFKKEPLFVSASPLLVDSKERPGLLGALKVCAYPVLRAGDLSVTTARLAVG
jgi:hypothetical protein